MDIQALWLTARLALVSTLILMVIAVPLAWGLSRWQGAGKALVQAVIALPLVLPPTVLGFYLLIAFSPNNAFGQTWQALFGTPLAVETSALWPIESPSIATTESRLGVAGRSTE